MRYSNLLIRCMAAFFMGFLISLSVYAEEIKLPEPSKKGTVSVEEAIQKRKSVRSYARAPLTLKEVSQILWAAAGTTVDGVTGPTRAYPSAGGIYPLEVYLVSGDVTALPGGVYYYDHSRNVLKEVRRGDVRKELSEAAYGQRMISAAPVTIVVTAVFPKTSGRYGLRGETRYVPMDAGHMGQNVHLQAESLGLGTVMVGAFSDKEVAEVLGVENETPVYIMPIGRPE